MKKKSGTNQKEAHMQKTGTNQKSPYAEEWNKPNKQMANRELNIAQNTAQKYRETKKKWK